MNSTSSAHAGHSRRFVSWLAVSAAAWAGVMIGLLFLQFQQVRNIEDSARLQADSITVLTFQFEREFLRLRHMVDTSLKTPLAQRDIDALVLRFDIFVSRTALLQDNPSIELIRQRPEYVDLAPTLKTIVAMGDEIFGQDPLLWQRMPEFLAYMEQVGPQVQALSFASNAVMSTLIETKQTTIQGQYHTILWLTLAQVVVLVVVAAGLWVQHKRMVRENLALEALAEDLRQAHVKAEAANQGKTRFLANMSHELRTPFNGMLGMLSLLEGTPLNEQQQDYVRTAKQSSQHLLTLLNDILDISAMEVGRLKLDPQTVQLPQLLSDVAYLMRSPAQQKNLLFKVEILSNLPDWVEVDPTRLKQILFNLINNGIKFTTQGHVCLRVELESEGHNLVSVRFTVEDTGIGMDEKAMNQLFQRFYQAESDTRRRFGGTGLGLEISRSLARMMGGDLRISSQLGVGSVFTLVLPLPLLASPAPEPSTASASAAPVVAELPSTSALPSLAPSSAAKPPIASVSSSAHEVLQGRLVLVAEDHPVNQKLVAALLKNMGCKGVFCENGQLAVDAMKDHSFDLVLMDIHMPVMDGLEASRRIRQQYPDPVCLPIIALSADVMNDAKDKALAAGINEFLSKPVRLPELKALMSNLVIAKLERDQKTTLKPPVTSS